MKIPAAEWNGALKAASSLHLQPGPGVRLHRSRRETVVSLDEDVGRWPHPWHVLLRWVDDKWQFRVKAGFVNGLDPLVTGAGDDENPHPPLLDVAWIPVHGTRPVGSDGSPVPKFFEKFGVKRVKLPEVTADNFDSINVGDLLTPADDAAKSRKLVAFDVYLTVARATYSLTTTPVGNLVTGHIVEYSVGYDTRALDIFGTRARLLQAPKMEEKQPLDLATRLSGLVGDDGLDRLLLATCYLLGPANTDEAAAATGEPDENWTPYIEHKCFWNLAHRAKNAPPVNLQQSPKDPFLAFFVGRYTVAPMATLGAMEAEMQRITAAVFNSTANEGVFWSV